MKKRELAETFERLGDAMGAIDCRAKIEDAAEDMDLPDRDDTVDRTVKQMRCLALGYVAGMTDARDIASGEDEVTDVDEYARGAMHDMEVAWTELLARDMFRGLMGLA